MRECRHCGAELYGGGLCEDAAACEERATGACDGPDDDDYSVAELDYFGDLAADRYERAMYGD